MPKHVADGGIVAGLLLIVWTLLAPATMNPGFIGYVLVFAVFLMIGFGVHLLRNQKPEKQNMSIEKKTVINNTGGGIGADINVNGTRGKECAVGLVTDGLVVTQNGLGIGMRISVGGDGPAIGVISNGGAAIGVGADQKK